LAVLIQDQLPLIAVLQQLEPGLLEQFFGLVF
jgi:hypothetical protein